LLLIDLCHNNDLLSFIAAMPRQVFLAIDLGASSGRVLAGLLEGQTLQLSEVHRFSHAPVSVNGRLFWRTFDLWSNVLHGLREAHRKLGDDVVSVGVDAWGVDFGLLDCHGELLAAPIAYRDARTQGEFERTFAVVPREEIFAATGVQFMEINTLYQLRAIQRLGSPPLDRASRLLMISDLFHWMLTGVPANELTIASTTQLYDPQAQAWSDDLIARLELPRQLFGPLIAPGTSLGPLLPEIVAETGLKDVQVVVPGSHDTASAVLAVPAAGKSWCYISSGTWSLMGIETAAPVLTEDAYRWNFTNEAGVAGTTRLLKNISGLWLIQECQRVWRAEGHDYDWQRLASMAEEAEPLRSVIDADDPRLIAPRDMPAKLVALCREAGQPIPETHGAIVRCALESLALKYREVLGYLERLGGSSIEQIHIVGGGSQNGLLCQMTADACERPVLAGPMEATAIGNVLMQAIAAGEIADVAAAREVVRRSFEPVAYQPRASAAWAHAAARLAPR
jgi:rhamnulokinase